MKIFIEGGEESREEKDGKGWGSEPVRINIPENRGESGIYHSDAAAYETRPPASAGSALQMSGWTQSVL